MIIYDLGANEGQNLDYYLSKSSKTVAVEANPQLCEALNHRFRAEVESGLLVIENKVLCGSGQDGEKVNFYQHKTNSVLSQFPPPEPCKLQKFHVVKIEAISIANLVKKHGHPNFIKIDLEGFDQVVVREMINEEVYPDYVSVECHSLEPFMTLASSGMYSAFKIVEGASVQYRFRSYSVGTPHGKRSYSFEKHSAGPFGTDLPGPWLNLENTLQFFAVYGPGWRDLHASRIDECGQAPRAPLMRWLISKASFQIFRKITPWSVREVIRCWFRF